MGGISIWWALVLLMAIANGTQGSSTKEAVKIRLLGNLCQICEKFKAKSIDWAINGETCTGYLADCPCLGLPKTSPVQSSSISSCFEKPHSSICAPVCNTGYYAQSHFLCDKGVWTGTPTCPASPCPALTIPANGLINGATTTFTAGVTTTVVVYTCATDYFMTGTATATCGTNSLWSTAAPICTHNPVDCVSSWSGFGGCSLNCGGGTQTRTLIMSTAPAYGGLACDTSAGSVQSCNTQSCCTSCGCPGYAACAPPPPPPYYAPPYYEPPYYVCS